MKVLHVSGARSWGGNEQQLIDIIPELEKLQVQNLVLGINQSPLHKKLQGTGVKFISAKAPKISKRKNFRFLKEVVNNENPHIIHLHTSDAVTLYVISDLIYKLNTPAVLSKKGMGSSMSFLSRYKYNYANLKKIICVSQAVKKDLMEQVINTKNHSRLEVIYDGVNLDRTVIVRKEMLREMFAIPAERLLLGNIANHSRAKDLGVLIKTMDHLVNVLGEKNVHLVQIGEFSSLTQDLKSLIATHKLEKYITLAGFEDHAVDFIPQFDIYVMSSQREGLPITIFEAFYKGTPVVSTKAGGIPEAITDGENGFLSEVGDHVTLAEKILKLNQNPELQEQFVHRSKEVFFKKFVASNTAKYTLELYNGILDS